MALVAHQESACRHLISGSRVGLILGTSWCDEAVLTQHFKQQDCISFSAAGLTRQSVSGHPGLLRVGEWDGVPVVISQGRVHLNEVWDHPHILRCWMGELFCLMDGGERLIITNAVGGLTPHLHPGTLAVPSELAASHLEHRYLSPSEGEYVTPESLLPVLSCESERLENSPDRSFPYACFQAARGHKLNLLPTPVRYFMIPGSAFGGRGDRRDLRLRGFHTVGMSLVPELCLTAVENVARAKDGRPPVRVGALQLVTDNNDHPSHSDNQSVARELAPRLGACLSSLLQAEW